MPQASLHIPLVWSSLFYLVAYAGSSIVVTLLSIFLRSLGLSASDVGLVTGIRPFALFVGIALWGSVADCWQAKRSVHVLNLLSYVALCLLLAQFSDSSRRLPAACSDLAVNESITDRTSALCRSENGSGVHVDGREALYGGHPLSRGQTLGLIVCMTLVFDFFASSWASLADLASLDHLGENARLLFGRLRLWGSLGLGLGVLVFGFIAQTAQSTHRQQEVVNGNYPLCLYIGAGLWLLAALVAVQFRFREHKAERTHVRLQQALRQVRRPGVALYLCAVLVLGWNMGLMMNFIFWYMQDLNAGQATVGIAGFVAQVSDIVIQILAAPVIKRLGHVRVMYVAILSYTARHLFLSFIHSVWLVFIPQAMYGLSVGLPWSSMANFARAESEPGTEAFMQGTLHALHWGFGCGLGAIVGGTLIQHYGARATFRTAGYIGAVSLFVFFVLQQVLQWCEKRRSKQKGYKRLVDSSLGQSSDEEEGEEVDFTAFRDASTSQKAEKEHKGNPSPFLSSGPLSSIMQALSVPIT